MKSAGTKTIGCGKEDGGALVFDSEPLQETMEVLGQPVVELVLSSDQPVAMVAVRLSDIAPDDKVTRVTYGLLNLCHRDSHENPELLQPEQQYRVQVKLNDIAQTFPAGHRFRVAVSTSYWPLAWPPPQPVRLTILTGASQVIMPVRVAQFDNQAGPFKEPEGARPPETQQLGTKERNWRVIRDLEKDLSTLEVVKDEGKVHICEIDLMMEKYVLERYTYKGDDFSSVCGEVITKRGLSRGDWKIKTVTRTVMHSDAKNFYLRADLDAYESGFRVYCKSWEKTISRKFV